jgi:hypothetical protein
MSRMSGYKRLGLGDRGLDCDLVLSARGSCKTSPTFMARTSCRTTPATTSSPRERVWRTRCGALASTARYCRALISRTASTRCACCSRNAGLTEKCERGIEALRQYRRDWDEKLMTFRNKPRAMTGRRMRLTAHDIWPKTLSIVQLARFRGADAESTAIAQQWPHEQVLPLQVEAPRTPKVSGRDSTDASHGL